MSTTEDAMSTTEGAQPGEFVEIVDGDQGAMARGQ